MVVARDGLTCRYCGLPVIPASIRKELTRTYPEAVPWGAKNELQHAAFQALWLQYDHVVPLARGGANDETNIIVTCGPCNFMKWDYTLDEVGLQDPRERKVLSTSWDGLTRLVGGIDKCLL